MLILYVDSDECSRKTVSGMLCHIYGRIIAADNGRDAFEKFLKYSPDIVITEVELRNRDGVELVELIKKENENVPVIIINKIVELYKDAVKAEGFVKKPIKMFDLISVINVLKKEKNNFNDSKLNLSIEKTEIQKI